MSVIKMKKCERCDVELILLLEVKSIGSIGGLWCPKCKIVIEG